MSPEEEVALRRLNAMKPHAEGEDLYWELTCKDWKRRHSDADAVAKLLSLSGRMIRNSERLPKPLAEWLSLALTKAAKQSDSKGCRDTLAKALNITSPQRRPKPIDRTKLRKFLKEGLSQVDMAFEMDVDPKTVRRWLKELELTQAEMAALRHGEALVRRVFGRILSTP